MDPLGQSAGNKSPGPWPRLFEGPRVWILALCLFLGVHALLIVGEVAHASSAGVQSHLVTLVIESLAIMSLLALAHSLDKRLYQQKLTSTFEELKEREQLLEAALAEAKHSDELTKCASHRFQELFAGLPVPCFTLDLNGTIYDWNRAASDLFGRSPESVYLQSAILALAAEEDQSKLIEALARAGAGESVDGLVWRSRRTDNSDIEVSSDAYPIRTVRGEVSGILVTCLNQTQQRQASQLLNAHIRVVQDLNDLLERQKSQLEAANSRLEALASIDTLTGLMNRRAFQTACEDMLQKARESGACLSLVLVDIDQFRSVNDELGHSSGDELLKHVGGLILEQASSQNLVARYGGEEFVVICPSLSAPKVFAFGERIRRSVEGAPCGGHRITISLGLSTYRSGEVSAQSLVHEAEMALTSCKEDGRNQVRHYDDLTRSVA